MSNFSYIKQVIEACLLSANDIIDLEQLYQIFDE